MKKVFSILILLLVVLGLSAQNVRFFFTIDYGPSTAKVNIFAQATAIPGNNMAGLDLEFWYDNFETTLSSVTSAPTMAAWTGVEVKKLHEAGSNPMLPIIHSGRFAYSNTDAVGTDVPVTPILLLELNFTGIMNETHGFLASSIESPGLVYVDADFNSYSIVVTGTQNQALPLELIQLSAKSDEKAIKIDWQTANETSFSHFDLERSTDGVTFAKIAKIVGNGATRNAYSYSDKTVKAGITYYYRLMMNDRDGTFSHSNIVNAVVKGKTLALVNVWPNPTVDKIKIQFETSEESDVTFKIFDINGKLLDVLHRNSTTGLNEFHLDLSNYPAGLYWLSIKDEFNEVMHKVMKSDF
jgi:hypothetical protein